MGHAIFVIHDTALQTQHMNVEDKPKYYSSASDWRQNAMAAAVRQNIGKTYNISRVMPINVRYARVFIPAATHTLAQHPLRILF